MRDRLFGSLEAGGTPELILTIKEQVGHDVVVYLMGEFVSLQTCVDKVVEVSNTGKAQCCFITGSLNYLPYGSTAKDIDVIVFVNGDKYTSKLKETEELDMTIVTMRNRRDIETSLNVLYPVSRYFYNLRTNVSYSTIVANISRLKEICTEKGFKSPIIPAFKGFVIATIAATSTGDLEEKECLKRLALLNTLKFDEDGRNVTIVYYDETYDASQMLQHQLILPGKTKRLGNASVRQGITMSILQGKDWTKCDAIEYEFPEGLSTDGYRMHHILTILNTCFSDVAVFVMPNENKFNVYYEHTSDRQPLPTVTTETVSFWNVTVTSDESQVSSPTPGIPQGERPHVKNIVETEGGLAVSDEVDSFVRAMMQRFQDADAPLISRHVEEDRWANEGLCLCHTNDKLPDILIFNDGSIKYTLIKQNEEAYTDHMSNWFNSTIPFTKGYTRFTNLIKLLDSFSRDEKRRYDLYTCKNRKIILKFDVGPIKPESDGWPVSKLREGWKQVREKMSIQESEGASSESVSASSASPSRTIQPPTTPTAPRRPPRP